MEPSYKKFHYGLRPAKNIERKMMCEAFRRLANFAKLEDYRYIGFGSIYFIDYCLLHRELGIGDMYSMEKRSDDEARVLFNKPFKCINIEIGNSNQVLGRILESGKKTILWLDYDYELCDSIIYDVETFISKAVSGCVLAVTIDAETDRLKEPKSEIDEGSDWPKKPVEQLKRLVNPNYLPHDISPENLRGDTLHKTYRWILNSRIHYSLMNRNSTKDSENTMNYKQIMHFIYSDGVKMQTIIWMFYTNNEKEKYQKCNFEGMEYFRSNESFFQIKTPILTIKEMAELDKKMPCETEVITEKPDWISEEEYRDYCNLYRWYPRFTEVDY